MVKAEKGGIITDFRNCDGGTQVVNSLCFDQDVA